MDCGGGTTNCTTDAGSIFSTVGPVSISADNFTDGVIQGENLVLDRSGVSPAVITWTLATPAKAFSFFGFDHDGGDIAITFEDGTTQMIEFMAAAGADDNLFVGVYDLSNFVTSVTFSSTDPAGISNWDRFSVANVVPIPAAPPLFLSALAFFGIWAWRKRALGSP